MLKYFHIIFLDHSYYILFLLNQTAAAEMENAVKRMEDVGVQSYILDLRNNPVSLYLSQLAVICSIAIILFYFSCINLVVLNREV